MPLLRSGLAIAALVLLAGCGAVAPTTPSPTVTPAPLPSPSPTATDATATRAPPGDQSGRTVQAAYDQLSTYPIGPVAPTCSMGSGSEERRYPPTLSNRTTVDGSWTNDSEAAALAERAAGMTDLAGPGTRMAPVPGSFERVRVTGETFDVRERYSVDRFAVATSVDVPTIDALVLEPDGNRTTVQIYYVAEFC